MSLKIYNRRFECHRGEKFIFDGSREIYIKRETPQEFIEILWQNYIDM